MSTRSRGVAALAVALVVALLATGCGGDDGDPSADPSAATSATSSESTAPAGPVAWVDQLPVGLPPTIGYVIGHTYYSPDGRMIRMPQDRGVTAIARLGDGFLVVDDVVFEGTAGVVLLDAQGRPVRHLGYLTGAPVLSADGDTLRWITFTPSEFGPEREPTRLHVADVESGKIRSRIIDRRGEIRPMVPQREGLAQVRVQDGALIVLDPTTREQVSRLASPGSWFAGRVSSAAWEDRAHLLVSVRSFTRAETAILRVDVRSGDWSLAVDWTPIERSSSVVFETRPSD